MTGFILQVKFSSGTQCSFQPLKAEIISCQLTANTTSSASKRIKSEAQKTIARSNDSIMIRMLQTRSEFCHSKLRVEHNVLTLQTSKPLASHPSLLKIGVYLWEVASSTLKLDASATRGAEMGKLLSISGILLEGMGLFRKCLQSIRHRSPCALCILHVFPPGSRRGNAILMT